MTEQPLAKMLREGNNLALDAGAGSGKTTTLVNTVTSIFLSDASLSPEEVLLLTFTEKAAAEMRERLYFLWQSLYAKVRTGGSLNIGEILAQYPGDIFLPEECAGSASTLRERLGTMNEYYGRLNVSTLHSFCLSLLREYTVEAECDPDFEVIDSFEIDRAFESAFLELLQEEFEKGRFDRRWYSFFDHFSDLESGRQFLWHFFREMCLSARDLFFLFRDKKNMIKETDILPYFTAFQLPYFHKLREYLLASSPPDADIETAFGRLGHQNDEIIAHLSAGRLPARATLDSFTEVISSINGNRLRSPIYFPLNREEFTHRTIDGGGLATETFRCTLPKLRDKVTECTRTLNRLHAGMIIGDLLVEKTGRMLEFFEKNKRGNLDFMDLLIRAATLPEKSKSVRDDLKRRYRYLFIDEFQDTDPVQALLCSFICEKKEAFTSTPLEVDLDQGKLFIVGDPRQSIYRFRRADPQMHSSMIDLITSSGGAKTSLSANYRSTRSLVTFYNTFFQTIFDRGTDYSFTYGPPLEPGRTEEGPPHSVCYYSLEKEVDREGFLASLLKGIRESRSEIEEGGNKRPVTWKDMAILYVGDFGKKVLSPLREKLSEAEIPLLMPSLKGFYDRQEVKDLLFLLETICDPANRTALYGALKSTIFGFTDTQLAGYFTGGEPASPDLQEALSMIERWTNLRDTVGAHELISKVLEDCGYEYSSLLFADGQRIFFNVEKLLLVAREFDQKYSSSLRDFTGFVRQQIRVAAEEGEIPYFEEGEDAVRIMSVHAAKGLEFPVVIYYLTGEFARKDPGPILYDRIRGAFGFTQPNFQTPSCYQMVEDYIEERGERRKEVIPFSILEQRKAASEALRLSYVAMTRARELLILLAQNPVSGVMRKNVIVEKLESFLTPYESLNSACPFTTVEGESRTIDESLRVFSARISRWAGKSVTPSRRRLKRKMPELTGPDVEPEVPIISKRGDKIAYEEEGFRFGSIVHMILEALPPFDSELFKQKAALSRIFFEKDEERARFLRITERMQKSPLLEKYRGWKLLGTEAPLTTLRDGVAIREAADLVLKEGRSVLVIDYKTGGRSEERDNQAIEQVTRYVESIGQATETDVFGVVWYIEEDEWIEIRESHAKKT